MIYPFIAIKFIQSYHTYTLPAWFNGLTNGISFTNTCNTYLLLDLLFHYQILFIVKNYSDIPNFRKTQILNQYNKTRNKEYLCISYGNRITVTFF